eukprot:3453232-Amphidinium_carterae.1
MADTSASRQNMQSVGAHLRPDFQNTLNKGFCKFGEHQVFLTSGFGACLFSKPSKRCLNLSNTMTLSVYSSSCVQYICADPRLCYTAMCGSSATMQKDNALRVVPQ